MNFPSKHHAELESLVEAALEGRLDDEQQARLNDLIAHVPDARSVYLQQMSIFADLRRHFAGLPALSGMRDILKQVGEEASGDPARLLPRATGATPAQLGCIPRLDAGNDLGVAADEHLHRDISVSRGGNSTAIESSSSPKRTWSISGVFGGRLGLNTWAVSRSAAAWLVAWLCGGLVAMAATVAVMKYQSQQSSPAAYVAQLTGARELQWASDEPSPMIDQLLSSGQTLRIESGWAEITFKGGARTVLEGPAALDLLAADCARLHRGKLAVELQPQSLSFAAESTRFAIDTPTTRVVDSGGEFGVSVGPEANTQIDVFEGVVNVHPLADAGKQLAGLPEWLSAGESLRVRQGIEPGPGPTVLERQTSSDLHFVRTLRSRRYAYGSDCIARNHQDDAQGVVIMLRDPTTKSGRASSFTFYNVHGDNDRWITPTIFALDKSTSTYRVSGIGQSVLNLGTGSQSVPFQLIAGSADMQAGVHTFGFYFGVVDKTGKATSASRGPVDYSVLAVEETSALAKGSPVSITAPESRWIFSPVHVTPVSLRLGLEFNAEPRSDQILLSPSGATFPDVERIYSGRLEIVVEPAFPSIERRSSQ